MFGKCQGCDDYCEVDDISLCDSCSEEVEQQIKKEIKK